MFSNTEDAFKSNEFYKMIALLNLLSRTKRYTTNTGIICCKQYCYIIGASYVSSGLEICIGKSDNNQMGIYSLFYQISLYLWFNRT